MSTGPCSQCGAPLHADQSWCSLCFAPAPEAFDPLTAPLDELAALSEPREVETAAPAETVAATTAPERRGRHAAVPAEPNEPPIQPPIEPVVPSEPAEPDQPGQLWQPPSWMAQSDEEPGRDGDTSDVTDIAVMFSMLSAQHRAMDPTAGFTDRMQDKSTRVAIMLGGALIVGAVLFLGLTLLGVIF